MGSSVSEFLRQPGFVQSLAVANVFWKIIDRRPVDRAAKPESALSSQGAFSVVPNAFGSAPKIQPDLSGIIGQSLVDLGSGLSIGRWAGCESVIALVLPGSCLVLVDRDARTISFDAPALVDEHTIKHHLADQVVPRILAADGAFVLHGAAIALGGGCIVLMAPSGSGKSTLSAAFDLAGHDLMGDDAAVLRVDGDICRARAIYPSLRLLPDSLAALYPGRTDGVPMASYSNKQRLDIAPRAAQDDGSDEAAPQELPVLAAFLLDRSAEHDTVSFTPLDTPRACMHLVENSFLLDPADPAVNHANLTQAAALAERLPFARLSYPDDLSRLPEVVAAIVHHVTGSPITPAAG